MAHRELCDRLCMKKDNVISTLQHLNLIHYYKGQYILCLNSQLIEQHRISMSRRQVRIDPKCLQWIPKDWSKRGKWRLVYILYCNCKLFELYVTVSVLFMFILNK